MSKQDTEIIKRLQSKIKNDKGLIHYDRKEIDYVQKPIGKSIYVTEKDKKSKTNWFDIIKCDVCQKEFMRSNRSHHNNTQYHKIYANINGKIKTLLIDEEK